MSQNGDLFRFRSGQCVTGEDASRHASRGGRLGARPIGDRHRAFLGGLDARLNRTAGISGPITQAIGWIEKAIVADPPASRSCSCDSRRIRGRRIARDRRFARGRCSRASGAGAYAVNSPDTPPQTKQGLSEPWPTLDLQRLAATICRESTGGPPKRTEHPWPWVSPGA